MKTFNDLTLQEESVKIPITINHLGWFNSDYSFGHKVKDYRDWIYETYKIKWDDYQSGMCDADQDMLNFFLEDKKLNNKYEFIFDEDSNGFFLVVKPTIEEMLKQQRKDQQ